MEEKKSKVLISKKTYVTLIVFLIVLSIFAATFSTLYAVNMQRLTATNVNLEKVYQRTFYDLVDSVNNTENKLSKLVACSNSNYANTLLQDINDNITNAEVQLSYLPISMNGISETTKFINQLGGYTKTLSNKTKDGTKLTAEEKAKLKELYNSIYGIKINLAKISNSLNEGYVISANIDDGKEDYNNFTKDFKKIKNQYQDYPTMIYDGPFSDSTLNKEIKGLNFEEISKEQAEENLKKLYPSCKVEYKTTSNGKFETYDFEVDCDSVVLYAQLTKKGGKLLTLSAIRDGDDEVLSKEEAITKAKEFLEKQGIKNMQCVWSDKLQADAYLNFAPKIDGVIIYPDLIKVKVDLKTGKIIGYEASTYYTNHTNRNIPSATISKSSAENKIESGYQIKNTRLALSPIEYEGEKLTYEIECINKGDTYYFFVNAQTGEMENILKVIKTTDGSKLM